MQAEWPHSSVERRQDYPLDALSATAFIANVGTLLELAPVLSAGMVAEPQLIIDRLPIQLELPFPMQDAAGGRPPLIDQGNE